MSKTLNRYKASDLLKMSYDELWNIPSEWHIVEFDDGEVVARDRETKLSVLTWLPLVHYSKPLLKDYHFKETRITSKAINEMINRICWDIHSHYNEDLPTDRLAMLVMQTNNVIYNELTIRCAPWVSTLSIFDVADIYWDNDVQANNANIEPNTYGIEEVAYKGLRKIFDDPGKFRGNSIIEGYRSGTQKIEQLNQAFCVRGSPTDINSDIFKIPVMSGYVNGIWELYPALADSRSGTKALAYNKELLRITEYFNRKSQLISQYVKRLHKGDCGSELYLEIPVSDSTLKQMAGKYYFDPDTNEQHWIKGNEKHLVGKKLKVRSVMTCTHPDPEGVCAKCYGRLSFSVFPGSNIGHIAAAVAGNIITSSVLSTKHTDATASVDQFVISGVSNNYLHYGNQNETLYLKEHLKKERYRLLIKRTEAANLADILMVEDLREYPITRATELSQIALVKTIEDEFGMEKVVGDALPVALYNRKASLSTDMLQYIRYRGWSLDERDTIIIEMDEFDHKKPFLTLPNKHVNMYEVMKRIQSFLHSGSDNSVRLSTDKIGFTSRTYLTSFTNHAEALTTFFNMVNEKLNIHFTHCEVLIYAMCVRDSMNKDYRLPKPGITGKFEKYTKIMANRSHGGALAFEKQHEFMERPSSFVVKERNDSPYDRFVLGGVM